MARGRILLVEDETMLHFLWEDICGDLSIEIAGPASTCEQAMAILDNEADKLSGVVLDVNLHGETSQKVAERLATMDLPVLVCSGSHHGTLPDVYHQWPTLSKPYRPSGIEECLKKLVFVI